VGEQATNTWRIVKLKQREESVVCLVHYLVALDSLTQFKVL